MTHLAKRMSGVQASAIREILKVTERPDVLSFAGGLPAPEAFPVAAIAQAHADVLRHDAAAALQYGPTEGYGPLRAWVAERMRRRGTPACAEQVLITAGAQQGIDLVGKALVDPGDTVVVEAPSYLAALQSFSTCEARFATVPSDDQGMCTDALERVLREERPRLVYVVPNFQNPCGTTLPLERRLRIARLAAEYQVTVLEDDPYGELRYRGLALPPIAGLVPGAPVIHLGSFSKTLAPGLRLGYAVADESFIRALTIAKQAADLHTGSLSQRAVARLLRALRLRGALARPAAALRRAAGGDARLAGTLVPAGQPVDPARGRPLRLGAAAPRPRRAGAARRRHARARGLRSRRALLPGGSVQADAALELLQPAPGAHRRRHGPPRRLRRRAAARRSVPSTALARRRRLTGRAFRDCCKRKYLPGAQGRSSRKFDKRRKTMKRVICSILAAGSAALSLSSAARADDGREQHRPVPITSRYDGQRIRDRDARWRDLRQERQRFYSFRHTRAECARFERWYARRCDQLRFHRS